MLLERSYDRPVEFGGVELRALAPVYTVVGLDGAAVVASPLAVRGLATHLHRVHTTLAVGTAR